MQLVRSEVEVVWGRLDSHRKVLTDLPGHAWTKVKMVEVFHATTGTRATMVFYVCLYQIARFGETGGIGFLMILGATRCSFERGSCLDCLDNPFRFHTSIEASLFQ